MKYIIGKGVFKDVVPTMAAACMKMKNKFGINLEGEECALTRFYILFMFRIQLLNLN